MCDPSQKGCFELLPQAHQKYVPGSRVTCAGIFAAIVGLVIIVDFADLFLNLDSIYIKQSMFELVINLHKLFFK